MWIQRTAILTKTTKTMSNWQVLTSHRAELWRWAYQLRGNSRLHVCISREARVRAACRRWKAQHQRGPRAPQEDLVIISPAPIATRFPLVVAGVFSVDGGSIRLAVQNSRARFDHCLHRQRSFIAMPHRAKRRVDRPRATCQQSPWLHVCVRVSTL